MSSATKCDRCEEFYAPAHGNVTLDVGVQQKDGQTFSTWSEVDLCPTCSTEFLRFIKPALNDLDPELGT